MGIFERWANLLFRTATGDAKRRWLLTPVVAFLFLCFLTIFLLTSFGLDSWLNFPSIRFLPWTLIAGVILLLPGIVLGGWTMILFARAQGTPVPINPPQKLLTGSIYAFSRNPMMTSIYLIFFAVGLLAGSLSLMLIFTPLFILIMTIYVMKVEEKELEIQFGQQYLDYKKKVGMYLPRIRPAK
ncbi:MAG: isoprenylcysteine carboxylmethyltransferase family protein [Dehalococcoidia bacterium]|nr:isoprenylcysteine carboxylmethyltransferase family protein [Dehalococcoidia bacterium]